MSKNLRRSGFIFLACVLLLLGVAGGVAWRFYGAMPDYAGQATIKGLSGKVSVYRDAYGVPHIFATNRADALRALGYAHASERFFQMEMQRRAGQGRLSEVVGKDVLGVDKFVRTLGLYDLAQSGYAAMSPDAQNLFRAYADGVNAWMDSHRHRMPPEFTLLGVTPDAWQPADSVVWGKLMALQLSNNYKREMLRAELAGKVSPTQMKFLFPAWGSAPVTMEPKLTQKAENTCCQQANTNPLLPSPPSVPPASGREAQTASAVYNTHDDALAALSAITSLDHAASNEWVIAGSRTQSGKPILANDPHLSLEAPILWYLARIVTPEGSVKGATVPGLPVVLLGQNNAIAWGMTTTGSDVQDLFIETVDPKNPANYLTPSGSKPFATHKEMIHVKGGADVVLTIRATRHGPVMSDIDADMARIAGDGHVMALAFTGLGEHDRTAEALLRINQATNWKDFLAALRLYQGPPQNVVYADTKGDIGFINPGLVPIRKKGDGLTPVDGASGAYDWQGTVPFDEEPKLYNPAAGFVFNANNALVSANAKRFYGTDWEEPYRAARLQHYFDSVDQHTLDSSVAMQADHLSLPAKEFLPFLLRPRFADNAEPRIAAVLDLLRGWDGVMDRDRPEPLIFEAWLAAMHKVLLVDPAGVSLKERGPFAANSIAAILASKDNGWCSGAACDALAMKALTEALDGITARQGADMRHWRWGREHTALLQHKVFKHLPILAGLSDLSVPSSGDFYTLDRGGSFDAPADHPFARQHGGGYRAVYDLGDPDHSRFMITTGESGHIFSKHYGDLVPLWNDVKAVTLSGSQKDLDGQKLPKLEFQPAGQ